MLEIFSGKAIEKEYIKHNCKEETTCIDGFGRMYT